MPAETRQQQSAETLVQLKKVVREVENNQEFENPVEAEIARVKRCIAELEAKHDIEENKYEELQSEYQATKKEKSKEQRAVEEAQEGMFSAKRKFEEAQIAMNKARDHLAQEKANLHALLKDLETTREKKMNQREKLVENERDTSASEETLEKLKRERDEEEIALEEKALKKLQSVTRKLSSELDKEQSEVARRRNELNEKEAVM
mmetsp:Transcript_5159/g.19344  ORF Transcript_5159/g.19344 Transcript_5159/m.19344 type:complete len:205 (-) Transcript_5159:131-745(-)